MSDSTQNQARLYVFSGSDAGPWRIDGVQAVIGESWPAAERLAITFDETESAVWTLRGIASDHRYMRRDERTRLSARQEELGRPAATLAALIPIRKTAAWWALAPDERREIFEEQSRHISIGFNYLPAVARKLYHCRDLSENEPFDFLTWFEFAPESEAAFQRMLSELRASREWNYVEREIEIRLRRDARELS
jgi:chlorite dismutase